VLVSHNTVATIDELWLPNYAWNVSFIWFMGLHVPYYTQEVATKTGLLHVLQIWDHR